MSSFKIRPMEHPDAVLVARLLTMYLSKTHYANRTLSEKKLPLTIFNTIEDKNRIGLIVEDSEGVARGAFLGGVFESGFFEGLDALEHGFALDPSMRKHTRDATKAIIIAFEEWAKSKGAVEVRYTITSGIPGKTLEQIFDETGYGRCGYCVRKEL